MIGKHLLLIVLQLGASGADAFYTHRNNAYSRRAYENNPIAAPFVRSTFGQTIYFSGETAVKLELVHWLRRRHHEHLADGVAAAGISDNAFGGGYSAYHLRGK